MWIDYKQAIAESAEQLLTVERRQRTSAVADRVKILRLLKTHPLLLPPYSPELNPAERWFEELRAALANTVFESTDMLMAALTRALEPYWTGRHGWCN